MGWSQSLPLVVCQSLQTQSAKAIRSFFRITDAASAYDATFIVSSMDALTGMVLKPEPIFNAVEAIARKTDLSAISTILLSPQGRLLTQDIARQLADNQQLILICGRYEGVDERVGEYLADDEISIGDYVLSGGEVAAMVIVDCMVRLLPDVLGSKESLEDESHINGLLEYPQYTRPSVFRGWSVPSILLSGNHAQIANWRRKQSLIRTSRRRPDLVRKAKLSREDKTLLDEAIAQNTNN